MQFEVVNLFQQPTVRQWCRHYMQGKASPQRIEEIINKDLFTLTKIRKIHNLTNDEDFLKMLDSIGHINLLVPLAFALNCFVKVKTPTC